MSYSNYRQIETAIRERREFTGNSAYATLQAGVYCVYSYQTLIASCEVDSGEVFYNPRKYSNTTSRLQNIVKRAWGGVN